MEISIIISLIIGFMSLILAFVFEGGILSALLEPTAALIVIGGTIGAVGASFSGEVLKKIPKIIGVAFKKCNYDNEKLIEEFKELAIKTRKNGLLIIEEELNSGKYDNFTKSGLQMVVDGMEPNIVRSALENKIENISERHHSGIAVFEAAGGFAPTMGIIGTVMGLVHVLGNLSNPEELGPKIAVAFIATLYGVGTANLLWLPISNKLKDRDRLEIINNSIKLEGIMLIQEGANSRVIEEKLKGYLADSK